MLKWYMDVCAASGNQQIGVMMCRGELLVKMLVDNSIRHKLLHTRDVCKSVKAVSHAKTHQL